MASGPITSWQIGGKTMETMRDFISWGSKNFFAGLTADGDCSHEVKRCLLLGRKAMKLKRRLLLGRKAMTIIKSILKSRDITLPTKICLVKVMVFPVVMYGCESWTI